MKWKILSVLFGCVFYLSCIGREFTVFVYNVENLFDLDGVALYSDYEQGEGKRYGVEALINKLEGIREVVSTVNDGKGPEVIMFQELELDRTPYDTPSAKNFLRATKGQSLEELLRTDASALNLPSELLLLKYFEDHGLTGYQIAQPDPLKMERHSPHKNVVFTRFDISFVKQRTSLNARDLLIVGLDVDGKELILFNNHWKSGASNASTEPIRVQNAMVVKAELEAVLFQNPRADVIIAGDLNSYYNHSAAFPQLSRTGVNDVLGATGFESEMRGQDPEELYNLWFELPMEGRGSEVWQGKWGTLMQIIITPGLYDKSGIQYVDNSFSRLSIPGMNVESRWGRPISWSNSGGGVGYSDHLPISARFRVVSDEGNEGWMELENPTNEEMTAERPVLDFTIQDDWDIPSLELIADMNIREKTQLFGKLFILDSVITNTQPTSVIIGGQVLQVYSPIRSIREELAELKEGDTIRAVVEFSEFRGQMQVVVHDASWLK